MAGAGYKLYSTGDVLSATDVNTYLQQQTVMVFASAAARTSALSAVLAEGMISYLQDTNSVEVYNGTAWAAVGGAGGGLTLLSTTTLSGATTTISAIDQTYKSLYLVMYGVTNATGNGQFKLGPNNNNTISDWVMQTNSNNAVATDKETAGMIYFNYTSNTTDRTSANNAWSMKIDNYASSTNYKVFNMSGFYVAVSGKVNHQTQGGIATNTAITSLVFTNAGGNLSTGTVELYGVK